MRRSYAAVDLGNSSGRVILGHVTDEEFAVEEICRFPNAPVRRPDGWHWDMFALFERALCVLRDAASRTKLHGIAVDTWGVDYGLLDANGALIDEPFSYRDERTLPLGAVAESRLPADRLYDLTGCQAAPINTLYQLLADQASGRLGRADLILLNPDLFAYWLTGEIGADETHASTTQLFDPVRRDWSREVIDAMKLPGRLFPAVRKAGTTIGHVKPNLGLPTGLPVINAAGHDTAAAFVAASGGSDQLVISIGTWSLVGVELTEPLITAAGREANFTNELGVLGTIRFLRNAAGLWPIQECLREWQAEDTSLAWIDLIAAAEESVAFSGVFDPDDRRFMEPGPMASRIATACDRSIPDTHGALIRAVLESLSLNHRWLLETVKRVLGRSLSRVRVVGGGAQNRLLCQMTADATGLPVVAGPSEATAIGNLAMQAIATGQIADLANARALIDRSFPATHYEPASDRHGWDSAYERWRAEANR